MPNVNDLTNTTWSWNFDHENTGFGGAGNGTTKNINFTSNNENFSSMSFSCVRGGDQNILTYGVDVVIDYDTDGGAYYDNPTYQVFTVTGGTDVTDSTLIDWIEYNATQVIQVTPHTQVGTNTILKKMFGSAEIAKEVINGVVIYEKPAPSGYNLSYTYEPGGHTDTIDITYGDDTTGTVGAGEYANIKSIDNIYYGGAADKRYTIDGILEPSLPYVLTANTVMTSYSKCFVQGTQITLSDYTTKNVEDITYDDELLVWNFYEGKLDKAKPIWIMEEKIAPQWHKVTLSDGTILKLVGTGEKCHRLFNVTKQQMLYADECVGDEVYKQDGTIVTVLSCEIVNEIVKYYNLTTDTYYDCFAEGILTGSRLNNMYHIAGMKYDSDIRLISEEEEAERWAARGMKVPKCR